MESKPSINTTDTKYLFPLITDFSFQGHGDGDNENGNEEDEDEDEDEDIGKLSVLEVFTGGDSPVSSSSSRTSTMSEFEDQEKGLTEDDDEQQEEEEEELTRADWKPVRNLPNPSFAKILAFHIGDDGALDESDFEFVCEREGGFNHVRLYRLSNTADAGTYVVKVPCVGTSARWQPQDAHMLRSKYGTMKLIRERTKCPVPEVVAYDDTLTNDLGVPYIITKACTGVQAFDVRYDEDEDGDRDYENTEFP